MVRYGRGITLGYPDMASLMPLPFYSANSINFSGAAAAFVQQFNNMSDADKMSTKVMNIRLVGAVIQEPSICCFVMTIVAGGFCIFPTFLLCCSCYQKAVGEIRDIPLSAYQNIEQIISQCPNLETINLSVVDSFLNNQKCSALQRSIVRLQRFISFTFVNMAGSFDVENDEYSNFQMYFGQIKANRRFAHNIGWGTKIYVFSDVQVSVNPMIPAGMQVYPNNPYGATIQQRTQMNLAGSYPTTNY